MAEKLTFSRGNLCINKCLIDAREKIQNAPRFEMNFGFNFAMCSADFTCVKRIHDPDSVMRIALKD